MLPELPPRDRDRRRRSARRGTRPRAGAAARRRTRASASSRAAASPPARRRHGRGAAASSSASPRSRISRVGEPVDAAVERDVLAHGQVVVQREALAHVADAAPHVLGLGQHVEAGDARLPRGRGEQPDQHLDRRRLPRAVGAEEAEHLAGANVERDRVHGGEAAEAARQLRAPRSRDAHAPISAGVPMSAMKVSSMPARMGATSRIAEAARAQVVAHLVGDGAREPAGARVGVVQLVAEG